MVTSNYIKGDLRKFGATEVSFNYEIDLKLTNKTIDFGKKSNVLVANLDRYFNEGRLIIDITRYKRQYMVRIYL